MYSFRSEANQQHYIFFRADTTTLNSLSSGREPINGLEAFALYLQQIIHLGKCNCNFSKCNNYIYINIFDKDYLITQ